MRPTLRLTFAFMFLFVPLSCVSLNQYSEKETQLEHCEKQMEKASKDLKNMEAKASSSDETASKCITELSDLQTQHAYLKQISKQLSQNNLKLERNLKKTKIRYYFAGKKLSVCWMTPKKPLKAV